MNLSRLYKVDNNIVFYSTQLGAVRQEYHAGLLNGTMIGYATDGSALDSRYAANAFIYMCEYYQEPLTLIEQIYRNMLIYPIIVSVVRSELAFIPDGTTYLNQLSEVIALLSVGMFDTASQLLNTIERNDVLTEERMTRWTDLVISSDAIKE